MFNVYISVYYDIEHVIKYRKEITIAMISDHSSKAVKNDTFILDSKNIKNKRYTGLLLLQNAEPYFPIRNSKSIAYLNIQI